MCLDPRLLWIGSVLVVTIVRPVQAEISAERVQQGIDRARSYLVQEQNRITGGWSEMADYPGAVTALCTLALLHAGDSPDDKHIQLSLAYLRKLDKPTKTYAAALQTMVFCAATPRKDRLLIRRNAQLLESWQVKSGPRKGAWWYGAPRIETAGDNSNSQFALLALHESERVGVEVSDQTWRRALQYWVQSQRADGSWGYYDNLPGTGSMTCAGITSVVIASGQLSEGDAVVVGNRVRCCGRSEESDSLQRALQWLGGPRFTVHSNPTSAGQAAAIGRVWLLYYLYGVERVGRLTGQRFLGEHDWYREGAEMLVSTQDNLRGYWKGTGHAESDTRIATSLALLFLSKGKRPVLMAKLKHGTSDDWNHHRHDVANLTYHVEQQWGRDMTWQIIDSSAASAEDLLQAPVLLLCGDKWPELSDSEKKNLRVFVDQGGFVFAVANCEGKQFDNGFRQIMEEIFPESPLRLLPPDHPVWFAEAKVDPRFLPELWGIEACCRTSVVFCPDDLSCYWELGRSGRGQEFPEAVNAKIAAYQNIGANVLAYATGRELSDKLDVPRISFSEPSHDPPTRGSLVVAKLAHTGGSNDAPSALSNLLGGFQQHTKIRVNSKRRLLAFADPALLDHPIAYMHGRRRFQLTEKERSALRAYAERGGVIIADSICASESFTASFRSEMQAAFPEYPLERIPADHPIFSRKHNGFELSEVTRRDPQVRSDDSPLRANLVPARPWLEGISIDGRYSVIFSPLDISCALENTPSLECRGYVTEDALKIGINLILYAMAD